MGFPQEPPDRKQRQRVPKRRYKCRRCGETFTVRTEEPLSEMLTLCPLCRRKAEAV